MKNKNQQRIAVYAGTFDPVTNGHKDIIVRASLLFDQLIIAIAASSQKKALFSIKERKNLLKEALRDVDGNIQIESFDRLLVDYVRSIGAQVIIRGLRAVTDYEYEAQMAITNQRLAPDIETIFLMTSEHCSFISSSIVKEISRLGGDVSTLVPKNVLKKLEMVFS